MTLLAEKPNLSTLMRAWFSGSLTGSCERTRTGLCGSCLDEGLGTHKVRFSMALLNFDVVRDKRFAEMPNGTRRCQVQEPCKKVDEEILCSSLADSSTGIAKIRRGTRNRYSLSHC